VTLLLSSTDGGEKARFLRRHAHPGLGVVLHFVTQALHLWRLSNQLRNELQTFSHKQHSPVSFDSSDLVIFSSVGAIGALLPRLHLSGQSQNPNWQLAGLLYGGVAVADAWIDSCRMSRTEKKDLGAAPFRHADFAVI
jgi:hypothetical protein